MIDHCVLRCERASRARRRHRLGFDFDGMLAVIQALTMADFHKSMTAHSDHRVWQDVYRPTTPAGEVYLKLTEVDDILIVSFKEL